VRERDREREREREIEREREREQERDRKRERERERGPALFLHQRSSSRRHKFLSHLSFTIHSLQTSSWNSDPVYKTVILFFL
jgi:hypothetical protein